MPFQRDGNRMSEHRKIYGEDQVGGSLHPIDLIFPTSQQLLKNDVEGANQYSKKIVGNIPEN